MTPAPADSLEALVAHYIQLVEYDTEWFIPFEVIELVLMEPRHTEIYNLVFGW